MSAHVDECLCVRGLYLVEADDVDDPGAEAGSGGGLEPDKVGVELGVLEVLVPHTPHRRLWDVLLIKVHQRLQEIVDLEITTHQTSLYSRIDFYIFQNVF